MKSTICAIATAPGGAIGIIRVSGPDAIKITDQIFLPANGKSLSERKSHTLAFGNIVSGTGEILDEVLISIFRAPHSYTGEDSTEISCHGSVYILNKILNELIAHHCEMATAGEYTKRAFLNGKLDLSQAEAVADLIASTSAASHRMAMSQMRGGFSKELANLRDQLLHITSLMELELDFSDHEDLEFADRSELKRLAQHIHYTISKLVKSFSVGNVLKNGIPVAIVGETNAGKSTLLNALLNEERAIVSDIHGTTRDVIEDTMIINGITFRFIDTAGIRETKDEIENLGIQRSFDKLEHANIVLWVIDATHAHEQYANLHESIISRCTDKKLIIILNKADQLQNNPTDICLSSIPENIEYYLMSAKLKEGINGLQEKLLAASSIPEINSSDIIVSNARHYEALSAALECIDRVMQGLDFQLSGDLVSQDLRECLYHLAEITGGQISTDEVLGNVFRNFCVGK